MPKRLGDRAWRMERPPGVSARALATRIKSWDGVIDVVVTEEHVAAYFEREVQLAERNLELLRSPDDGKDATREHTLPVVYDGEDLATVAAHCGLTIEQVIEAHLDARYEVAMMGFLPGFAYLTGLDPRLVLPRRETPRPVVAKGSLAIANGYTGIYPRASPGGWHLMGRSLGPPLFTGQGALLALGDRVRFVRHA